MHSEPLLSLVPCGRTVPARTRFVPEMQVAASALVDSLNPAVSVSGPHQRWCGLWTTQLHRLSWDPLWSLTAPPVCSVPPRPASPLAAPAGGEKRTGVSWPGLGVGSAALLLVRWPQPGHPPVPTSQGKPSLALCPGRREVTHCFLTSKQERSFLCHFCLATRARLSSIKFYELPA